MDAGLHYGLAAWINGLRPTDDFVNCPTLPTAIDLVDLESIQNMDDLAKAADFARLTNFIPRQSGPIDTATNLWQTHYEVLKDMEFATRPWDGEDRAAYNAAFDLLYLTDELGFRTRSEQLVLYDEYKRALQDAETSGGTPSELHQAVTDWIALGHKLEIEAAMATMNRLTLRSSLTLAENEKNSLEAPDGIAFRHQSDRHFAPVYFSPISAVAKETWMEANVKLSDMDVAAGKTHYAGPWRGYRSKKEATVTFKYTVLDCSRSWFSTELYQADDWKLDEDHGLAAAGDGKNGKLPAYVHSVYLASVENVKVEKIRLRNPKPTGKIRLVEQRVAYAKLNSLQGHKLRSAKIRRGAARYTSKAIVASKPVLQVARTAEFAKLSVGGHLQQLTAVARQNRFTITAQLLRGRGLPVVQPTGRTTNHPTYVVGYGCRRLPKAPDPNPHYEW